MVEFVNASNLDFSDVSTEEERTYTFPGGHTVTITEPLKLNVSKSGGHRLFAADGVSHYVPAGWLGLSWKTKPGAPHFVF